jgi:hypothetical protein
MMVRHIKANKGVRLEKKKLQIVSRIEAGERQVGVSRVLCLSGPTCKYLLIALGHRAAPVTSSKLTATRNIRTGKMS